MAVLRGYYQHCTDLQDDDVQRIERVLEAAPVLSDVLHADVLVYARSAGGATVVFHAAPRPVPSLYPRPESERTYTRHNLPLIFRVLEDGQGHGSMSGALLWGAPALQEVFQILDANQRVIAAVGSNRALVEHDRFQRRSPPFKSMVARVRDQVLAGRLRGAANLGRLTEHDGVVIVDRRGIIRYMSSVAENQYRRVGYPDSLLGEQISELDTNEYICFRSMEGGLCLEQRIQEADQVWIKRVLPLLPTSPGRMFSRLRKSETQPDGVVVFIQDITEDVRREQEIRTKSAMIQEVHHRVKNNLQTVASLLRMEARRVGSDEARDMLRRTMTRIASIAVVHEFLSRGEGDDIDIRDICLRITAQVRDEAEARGRPVDIFVEGVPFALPAQQATSCALAMNELLENAVEHGFANGNGGSIRILLGRSDMSTTIEIRDDGIGLPEAFDPDSCATLGLRIVHTLVEDDLKGRLHLLSGNGTTARISFPAHLSRPLA